MNKTFKLTNNPLFRACVGDRAFRLYKKPVDARLGMPGLEKLVTANIGRKPRLDEAYVFYVSNRDIVKVLTRDPLGTNLLEFHHRDARDMKEVFIELGLLGE